jgi:protein-tyrosine sulfotransferase
MIFIAGAHKSGTTLVRALLDGHPDLAVIPFETHLAEGLGLGLTYPLRSRNSPTSPRHPEAHLRAVLRDYLVSDDPFSDGRLDWLSEAQLDRRARQGGLGDAPDPVTADWVESYLARALQLSTGEEPDGRELVEKSVENLELVGWLLGLDQSTRVVQIARDPLDNIAAVRRAHDNRSTRRRATYPPLRRIVDSVWESSVRVDNNAVMYRGSVHTMRYERLLDDPATAMRRLAEFLDIEFRPTMLEPTVRGEPWPGNSSFGVPIEGIGRPEADRSHGATRLEERLLDQRLRREVLAGTGARRGLGARELVSMLRPERSEGLLTYLVNRAAVFDL